ncbi:hypothetical protein SAMN04489842_0164 [Natronobacterium texcoconense]|uniref:Lipoprotein n=1 Tax=Natronobacterium texcoconense TaxID=1095778 RepID=A0A1H0Z775_NATTX|nr:hypothetical protein SAMN04489842_0164 [Natronobacterium texcoconense]
MKRRQLLVSLGAGSTISTAGCTSRLETGVELSWITCRRHAIDPVDDPPPIEIRVVDDGNVVAERTVNEEEFWESVFDCRWGPEQVSYTVQGRFDGDDEWLRSWNLAEFDADPLGAVVYVFEDENGNPDLTMGAIDDPDSDIIDPC